MRKRRRGGEAVLKKYSATVYCRVLSGGGGGKRGNLPPLTAVFPVQIGSN